MKQPAIKLDKVCFERQAANWERKLGCPEYFSILKDISFSLVPGDRLAILGRNGAGKSTLLRILAGILPPSAGDIKIKGTVSTLFTASAGFVFNATGYENIKIMARILGIPYERHAAMIREIEEFTELGFKLHEPLRTYSAGMKSRLGFAVAASINPEILLIDEVIGAGDNFFRKKAEELIKNKIQTSGIVAVASHSEAIIKSFCDKAILLENGHIRDFGKVDDVFNTYNNAGS
jgi:ABC-type polysaccharide/polyol phosphate transport system ATPase subunit